MILTKEKTKEILKDKDVQYLLSEIAEAKQSNIEVDIKILIKNGRIIKKYFTTRKFIK